MSCSSVLWISIKYTSPREYSLPFSWLSARGKGGGGWEFPLWYPVNLVNFRFETTLWKKVIVFPVHSRDVTNQSLPGRELLNYSRPGRVWLVTSPLGTGKTITFFTVYTLSSLFSMALVQCTDIYSKVMKKYNLYKHDDKKYSISPPPICTLQARKSFFCTGEIDHLKIKGVSSFPLSTSFPITTCEGIDRCLNKAFFAV